MNKPFLRLWAIRILLLLLGLTIAHFGVTLFLQSALGSDPFNVLIQGLFRFIPWPGFMTHGTVHMLVSVLIIVALLLIDKSYIRIGTVLCMALGGPIIDGFTLLIAPVIHESSPFWLRGLSLVLGCLILAFGMTIVIKAQCGTGPNDLVGVVLSDKIKKKFGIVRILVDIAFALIGWLLGGTLGVGTIVCAALVGPTAQLFFPVSEKICRAAQG